MSNPEAKATVEKLIDSAADAQASKWVVTYGDAFEGIGLVGPFENETDALTYARRVFGDDTVWSVRQLEPPESSTIEIGVPT
jgi:hypothetical protein